MATTCPIWAQPLSSEVPMLLWALPCTPDIIESTIMALVWPCGHMLLTAQTASVQFSSVAQSCLTLRPHGLQHARLPCPSLYPRICSNSCPLSWWCYPTISFSVTPFSSHPQSFPASRSFPMSQIFESVGQSIGASALASVLPMNIQGWFTLGLTSLISLLSSGICTPHLPIIRQ